MKLEQMALCGWCWPSLIWAVMLGETQSVTDWCLSAPLVGWFLASNTAGDKAQCFVVTACWRNYYYQGLTSVVIKTSFKKKTERKTKGCCILNNMIARRNMLRCIVVLFVNVVYCEKVEYICITHIKKWNWEIDSVHILRISQNFLWFLSLFFNNHCVSIIWFEIVIFMLTQNCNVASLLPLKLSMIPYNSSETLTCITLKLFCKQNLQMWPNHVC